jgi:hypothetical protein
MPGLMGTQHVDTCGSQEVVGRIQPRVALYLVGVNDLALSLASRLRNVDPDPGWRWALYRHSRLIQILHHWYLVLFRGAVHVQDAVRLFEFRRMPVAEPSDDELVTLLPELPEFEGNVRALIRLCHQANVQPIFMTQPLWPEDTLRWRAVEGSFYWAKDTSRRLSAATYARMMTVYNRRLLAICQSENVACFDLARSMPHDDRYYEDLAHFTPEGCARVARLVADYLLTQFPKRPPE